jgi:hypothetical protein
VISLERGGGSGEFTSFNGGGVLDQVIYQGGKIKGVKGQHKYKNL